MLPQVHLMGYATNPRLWSGRTEEHHLVPELLKDTLAIMTKACNGSQRLTTNKSMHIRMSGHLQMYK